MEKKDKSLLGFIWKYHLIIYLSILILGLYFDFIHLSITSVDMDEWFGFRYSVDFNFTVLADMIKDAYNALKEMIVDGLRSFKKEIYK